MTETKPKELRYVQYELEFPMKSDRQTVWKALIAETNAWWLHDFHMLGESSVVEFDVRTDGRGLVEYRDDGSFLQWFSVQFFLPTEFQVYLIGNIAPHWGGPSTTNLFLSVEDQADGCMLRVSDAQHGAFDDNFIESLKSGWNRLFGEGLRNFVEAKN